MTMDTPGSTGALAPESADAAAETPSGAGVGIMEIVATARATVAFFTELPVDAVASCLRRGSEWVVRVDVVEARARLGDNDLIASYEIVLDAAGAVLGLERTGRYHRDDASEGGG
jgi:hypothetical protein